MQAGEKSAPVIPANAANLRTYPSSREEYSTTRLNSRRINLPAGSSAPHGGYELQLQTIKATPRLFRDETPMPVLDPGRRRTRSCQFWAHTMDDRPWGGPSPPAAGDIYTNPRQDFSHR
jgi:hypothetical protein